MVCQPNVRKIILTKHITSCILDGDECDGETKSSFIISTYLTIMGRLMRPFSTRMLNGRYGIVIHRNVVIVLETHNDP